MSVSGFAAENLQQKKQITIHEYKDEENFIISLKPKSTDELILIKT